MTLYKAPSGALVFGAGTIQWAWGLDSNHDRGSAAADVAAQQATLNLFADMGVQPTTLRPGLVAATASTDAVGPDLDDHRPRQRRHVPVGNPLTVTGTAADTGGGRVGGVEVSTDNGATWHRATGRETWSYSFTPSTAGTITIRSRATDDSANIQTPAAGVTVTVGNGPATCPCTIWPGTATPARDRPRHQLGRAGREVPRGDQRVHHRDPLLQAGRRPPAPTSAPCGPAPAPSWARPPSPTRPPAAGSRPASPRPSGHGGHDLRGVLLHAVAVRRQRGLLRQRADRPRSADRAPERHRRRQRSLPLRRTAGSSRTTPTTARTTGSTSSSPTPTPPSRRSRAGPRPPAPPACAGHRRDGVVQRAGAAGHHRLHPARRRDTVVPATTAYTAGTNTATLTPNAPWHRRRTTRPRSTGPRTPPATRWTRSPGRSPPRRRTPPSRR